MNKKETLQIPPYAVKAEERIRWSDLDAAGIMYFGQYVRLFEIGETEFFRTLGFPYTNTQFEDLGVWMLRVNFSCDFHSPAYIDDLLTIYCWADTIGGASIKLRFAVERDSMILGDGSCTIVSVDRINKKAVKIPDALRSALEKNANGEIMKTIILTGATGLIGEAFINLFSMPRNSKLIIVARKKPDFELPKGVEVRIISDFFDEDALREALRGGNEMICCIGTTIKKAGSKKAFEKTDVGIIELLAQCCSELDYDGFHYVSSIDSSIESKAFYLQCKGRAEMAIQLKRFKRISILRPSLLLGKRREFRLGEKIGMTFSAIFLFVLVGPLKRYRPIKADTVAKCLLYRSMSDNEDMMIFESEEIKTYTTLNINF